MVQMSVCQDEVIWFRNEYVCDLCGIVWADEWSCECNDRCPGCDLETEPLESIETEPSNQTNWELAISHANHRFLAGR